jgi:hypothetical protein
MRARGPRRPCGSRRRRTSVRRGPPRRAAAVARGGGLRRRRSGRRGARRPRERPARAPGRPGGPRARVSGARGGPGRSGGVCGRRRRIPRRRSGKSTATAADSGGEKAGERGEVAIELTVGRFWAEETSERELDEEGRSSAGTTMASGGLSSVLSRFGRGRARPRPWRDGRASGRGVVVWSATNRVAAARTCRCDERRRLLGAARSSLARRALRRRKEDGDGTRSFEVVREVKSGAQRDGRRVEARRRPQSPVWRRTSQ